MVQDSVCRQVRADSGGSADGSLAFPGAHNRSSSHMRAGRLARACKRYEWRWPVQASGVGV